MNTAMISYLKLIYQSIYLPLHYYKDGICLLRTPLEEEPFDFVTPFLPLLFQTDKQIHYFISDEFLYFGIVQNFSTGEAMIIGPVSTTRVRYEALPFILAECSIPSQYKDDVWNYFQMTPVFSHDQFISLLALINTDINQEIIDPYDYFEYEKNSSLYAISKIHSSRLYQAKETGSFHNTYQFERELYHYVEEGNIAEIQKLARQGFYLVGGDIGENSLRQEKNLLISSVTLLIRYSIAGGLDIETAYYLGDTYMMASEKAQSIEAVHRLSYTAIQDFTRRVAANKIPKDVSPDIFYCVQFISTHTNRPLSIGDIAAVIGKSPSYLSKKFKKEMGCNLSEFIMSKRLEEGKSLLTFTNKPISEISEYLCFSSQSYFQNVFKKKYGITPYEYRKSTQ